MPRRIRSFLSACPLFMGVLTLVTSLMVTVPPAAAQDREQGRRIEVIRDAETETFLQGIATSLYRVAGLDPRSIRIVLVRDQAINAFVTGGNRVFVHSGLIMRAGSASEVVGTLAHETGHVAHGDVSRIPEVQRQAMWRMLGGLLIAGAAGVASRDSGVGVGTFLGGASMAQRHLLSFTRGQEEAADQSGLAYLDRLGWSADGLLRLFERLDAEDAMITDRRDPFAMTHPLTRSRIDVVKRHIAAQPRNTRPVPLELEDAYLLVRAKLDGFLSIPATVLTAYPESDTSSPAIYARVAALHRMGRRAEAIQLTGTLIARQPRNPWFRELRGQIYFETGHPKEAVADYTEAVRLAPDQPLLRQGLGQAQVETGDKATIRAAIPHLEIAQRADPGDEGTWHLLGVAWGRLGDVGRANLALAEEAILGDDRIAARRFAHIAAEALPPGPSRQRALDIEFATKKENRL